MEPGWYYLGPAANNGGTSCRRGVVVKPAGEARVLAPIADWEKVWDNTGSINIWSYSLWRGVPSAEDSLNFVVIGGFFVRSLNKPTAEESRGMMAVHKDVLVTASPGKEVWNDAGTIAFKDGAVWDVVVDGNPQAVGTGAFVPVDEHDKPPRITYALNRDRISFI